ncbi:MAG: hypothetical protein KA004_15745 [Verrucomicrobiales bacterium]|nr:hypothetical protein [Verrucomicrobiales bacterium]
MNMAHVPRHASGAMALFWAFLGLCGMAAPEMPFRVESAGRDGRGHAAFSVASAPGFYYQLLRTPVPGGDGMAVDMKLGTGGEMTLIDNIPALQRAFFQVRRVPVAQPLDSDGDGLDDAEELLALPDQNPFNAAGSVPFADGAIFVPTQEALQALSHFDNFPGAPSVREVKFLITHVDTANPRLHFLNASRHIYHYEFARSVLNYRPDLSYYDGLSQFNGETYWTNTARKNLAGSLVVHESWQPSAGEVPGIITLEFWPSDAVSFHYVQTAYDLITRSMPSTPVRIAYHAASEPQRTLYQMERTAYDEARRHRLHVIGTQELFGQTSYTLLNPGVGFGRLVVFDGTTPLSARDVVIFNNVPNDITHVAGIITAVPQTPLSHVNLKAKQNNTPNAFVRDAVAHPALSPLLGKTVRFETLAGGFTVREATAEEVETHLESLRPPNPQVPQRDLTETAIKPLSQLAFASARAFGAKTANVAELRKIAWSPGVYVPDGFGIPFYFYDEFMKANSFYAVVTAMLAEPQFQSDALYREASLKILRDQIEVAPLPEWMMDALTTLQDSFPAGQGIRCRSSTNNEDLTGFNGAGLYDSFTHRTNEGHLSHTVKQVWASLWGARAFDEREFYRVDHLAAAMGILVHKNTDDELANGVGVTKNLIDPNWTGYYVNAQVGENLITNPDANSVPEEFLIARLLGQTRYTVQYVTLSNLIPEGQTVLATAQAELLADQMEKIQAHFRPLYGYPAGFAMELEWKIDTAGNLQIKQARPWVE